MKVLKLGEAIQRDKCHTIPGMYVPSKNRTQNVSTSVLAMRDFALPQTCTMPANDEIVIGMMPRAGQTIPDWMP